MTSLSFASDRLIAAIHRQNFRHLYLDIAGFGVLNGSAIAFVHVYAARLGAGSLILGLLTALPAITALSITLPAGRWLQRHSPTTATTTSALLARSSYLLFALVPWLVPAGLQLNVILLLVLLTSVPGAVLAIAFNTLHAAAVPYEWRGEVASKRNSLFAVISIVVTLISGWILDVLPFPLGYQVTFALGFVGGLYSTYHLSKIRPLQQSVRQRFRPNYELARPGLLRGGPSSGGGSVSMRVFSGLHLPHGLTPAILQGRYGKVLLLLFVLHFSQYFSIPLHPLRYVTELQLSDQVISYGNALFYLSLFGVSTRFAVVSRRLGFQRSLALSIVVMALFPFWIIVTDSVWGYLIASVFGGSGVALMMGASGNYILDQSPDDPTLHLAWYNMALNAAILSGALCGPFIAEAIGLLPALATATVLRLVSGALLWRLG